MQYFFDTLDVEKDTLNVNFKMSTSILCINKFIKLNQIS